MNWNATHYQQQYSYIWQHGESLLAQLNPQVTEKILDLGCGTGQLAGQISASGAEVIGIDSDPNMIAQAQANYPHITFKVADAADFQLVEPVDAVFSNAALHWVTQAEDAARCVARSLKPNGRFVAELGGKGNVQTILTALETALETVSNLGEEMRDRPTLNPLTPPNNLNPWYFPSIGEYSSLLEKVGFEVVFAQLFDRPTPLGDARL